MPGSKTRRFPILVALATLCGVGTMSYPSLATSRPAYPDATTAGQRHDGPPRRPASAKPSARFEEYRVAAGTALPLRLGTALSSNTSRVADVVEGTLLRAITADDVELVPAGATVLGTVTEAEPAGPKKPGRLVLGFTVIEHPETGSRAMIRASALAFRTDLPARGKLLPEVQLPKGMDATVTLLQPLLVRIPIVASTR